MGFTSITRELTPIQPEIVFSIGNFGIANSTLMVILIALIFLAIGLFVVPKFLINEDGSLRINKKILHLFEFYLSAIGEEPLERIIARINHNLTEQLTAQALTEALDILDGYLQFRNAITAIKQEHNQMASDDYASFEHIIISRNELIATRWRFLSEEVIAKVENLLNWNQELSN